MFSESRARVRAVSDALAALEVADLYALQQGNLLRLRVKLRLWSEIAEGSGRDKATWPTVRQALAALVKWHRPAKAQ